jgi:hypothetical protein
MAVKYLRKAAEGAAVTDYNDVLGQQSASEQEQVQLGNQIALVNLLAGLDNQMSQENRLSAQTAADSYHPSAQYQMGLNPGGLWDAMSSFMGRFGPAPSVEGGQRLLNRVPMGGSDQSQGMGGQQGSYGTTIADLLATIIEQVMADEQSTTEELNRFTPDQQALADSMGSLGQGVKGMIGGMTDMAMAPDNRPSVGGGGLEDLVNSIISGTPSREQDYTVNPLVEGLLGSILNSLKGSPQAKFLFGSDQPSPNAGSW